MKRPLDTTYQQQATSLIINLDDLSQLTLTDVLEQESSTPGHIQAIIKMISVREFQALTNHSLSNHSESETDLTGYQSAYAKSASVTDAHESDSKSDTSDTPSIDSSLQINLIEARRNQEIIAETKYTSEECLTKFAAPSTKKIKTSMQAQENNRSVATERFTALDSIDKDALLQCEKNARGTIKLIASEDWLMPDPLINRICRILATLSIDEWLEIEQGDGAGTLQLYLENLNFKTYLSQLAVSLKTMSKAQCLQWETSAPGTLKRLLINAYDPYCPPAYQIALIHCLCTLDAVAIRTIEQRTPHTLKHISIFLASESFHSDIMLVQSIADHSRDTYHRLLELASAKYITALNQFDKNIFLEIENQAPFTLQVLFHTCVITDSAHSSLKAKLTPTETEFNLIQQEQRKYLLKKDLSRSGHDEYSRLVSLMTLKPRLLLMCLEENGHFIKEMTPIEQCAVAHTLSGCSLDDWIIIENGSHGTLKALAEVSRTKNITLPKCLARAVQVKHPITALSIALRAVPLTKLDKIITVIETFTPGTKAAIRKSIDDIMQYGPEEQREIDQITVGEYIKRYQRTCHVLGKYSSLLSRKIKFESPKTSTDNQSLFAAQKTVTHAQKHEALALVYSYRALLEETYSMHQEVIESILIKQMQRIISDYCQYTHGAVSHPVQPMRIQIVTTDNLKMIMQSSWHELVSDVSDDNVCCAQIK